MINMKETVFITGTGRGLGRTAALSFSRAGFAVGMCSRGIKELDSLADEIKNIGGTCYYESVDVRDLKDLKRLAQQIADALGPISVLVNNAATIGPPKFIAPESGDISASDTIDINLKGAMGATQAVLPFMLDQGRGTIINLISGLAWMPFPRFSAYCASKAGLHHLTRCWAEEYKDRNIRVYSLDPGVMDTPMQSEIRSLGRERLGPLWQRFQEMKDNKELRDPNRVAEKLVTLAVNRPAGKNGQSVSLRDDIA